MASCSPATGLSPATPPLQHQAPQSSPPASGSSGHVVEMSQSEQDLLDVDDEFHTHAACQSWTNPVHPEAGSQADSTATLCHMYYATYSVSWAY
jgi:hypothetical protein